MTFHGGGEEFVFELARMFEIPIYTSTCSIDVPEDVTLREFGETGFVASLRRKAPFNDLGTVLEYENFDVPEEHDAVLSSGDVALSVIHSSDQRRYHLFHGSIRWLYNSGPGLFASAPPGIRFLKQLFQSRMRVHTQTAVSRIDDFFVNSEIVARELDTYHDQKAEGVMYPPVDLEQFHNEPGDGFLLYIGRLEKRKRVDEIIETVNGTEYRLEIAGTGEEVEDLKQMSGENVTFHGFVSPERKLELLARCDAVVFNSEREPFGIVPVEAFASGKPVVGINEGFTRYQISEGVNGLLYERGELADAIGKMYDMEWDPERIQETAEPFGLEEFRERWHNLFFESPSQIEE